jgi:hypothetical protein
LIAKPLYGGSGDSHRPFEGVGGFVLESICESRQESRRRTHHAGAGVQQHEVAGSVRVLGLARRKARLAHHRGVLIAEVAGNRNPRADRPGSPRGAERGRIRRGADARQHPSWDTEHCEELVVPVEPPEIHELRPAGIGGIRDVKAAAGPTRQVPDQPAVDGAEQRIAAFGRGPCAVDGVEDPLQLGG